MGPRGGRAEHRRAGAAGIACFAELPGQVPHLPHLDVAELRGQRHRCRAGQLGQLTHDGSACRGDRASLRYEVIETPERIRAGIARYLRTASLAYSAFDFVVTPDGEWVALEANGSGMWGWLAEECGLPIAEAIAEELTGK
ncbi:MAG: hypothetical protein ACRDTH_23420 [Pseudonocardiaceae bacterium]